MHFTFVTNAFDTCFFRNQRSSKAQRIAQKFDLFGNIKNIEVLNIENDMNEGETYYINVTNKYDV